MADIGGEGGEKIKQMVIPANFQKNSPEQAVVHLLGQEVIIRSYLAIKGPGKIGQLKARNLF